MRSRNPHSKQSTKRWIPITLLLSLLTIEIYHLTLETLQALGNARDERYLSEQIVLTPLQSDRNISPRNETTAQEKPTIDEPSTITSTSQPSVATSDNTPKRPVFLMGIFSSLGKRQAYRRNLIRRYLTNMDDSRVCPLNRFKRRPEGCELIYTFVVGANVTSSTELIDESKPLTVPRFYFNGTKEKDITYLNIRENMEDGKSVTWLRYASIFAQAHNIDHVIKCDDDTVLYVKRFFQFVDRNLVGHSGKRVYMGSMIEAAFMHDGEFNNTELRMIKDAPSYRMYMEGQFYLLSTDLASFVGSHTFQHKRWFRRIEDHDVGVRAFQHPEPLNVIPMKPSQKRLIWNHPVKSDKRWEHLVRRARRENMKPELTVDEIKEVMPPAGGVW